MPDPYAGAWLLLLLLCGFLAMIVAAGIIEWLVDR